MKLEAGDMPMKILVCCLLLLQNVRNSFRETESASDTYFIIKLNTVIRKYAVSL